MDTLRALSVYRPSADGEGSVEARREEGGGWVGYRPSHSLTRVGDVESKPVGFPSAAPSRPCAQTSSGPLHQPSLPQLRAVYTLNNQPCSYRHRSARLSLSRFFLSVAFGAVSRAPRNGVISNPGIRWSILPIGIRSTLLYGGTFFKDDGQPSSAGEAGVFRLAG